MEEGFLSGECLWKVVGVLMIGCYGDCFNYGIEIFFLRSFLFVVKDSNFF